MKNKTFFGHIKEAFKCLIPWSYTKHYEYIGYGCVVEGTDSWKWSIPQEEA